MNKKLLAIILTATMLFMVMTSCGKGSESNSDHSGNDPDGISVDTQNPVMNIVGEYAADRAVMLIEAEGEKNARITINWGSSAWENTQWFINGEFDAEKMTIEYTGATRTDTTYADNGEVEKETVVYQNGAGRIIYNDVDASITWEDDTEHAGDGLAFRFIDDDPGDPDYYKAVTDMPKADVEAFCLVVRDAYIEENWDILAEMVRYPIVISETQLKNTDEFVEFMKDMTVEETDRTTMSAETCHDMFFNGVGICMGSGQIWLEDPNYMTDKDPRLDIIGMNGIVNR